MRKMMARAWIPVSVGLIVALYLALPQSFAAELPGGRGENAASVMMAQVAENGPAGGELGGTLNEWTSEAGRIAREKAQNDPVNLLRQRISACWIVPSVEGVEKLKTVIRFGLDGQGKFSKLPEIAKSSGNAKFDTSTLRAVQRCGESDQPLPEGNNWSQIEITLDGGASS